MFWKLLRKISLVYAATGFVVVGAQADGPYIKTPARQAVIMDYATGTILYDKDAVRPMPPASMSKLMTVAIVLDKVQQGELTLDTTFKVSRKAWTTGGSKMFVLVDTHISVRDLLRGIIIQSGNDACVVVAENIAGSEQAFVQLMNYKAREWGLTQSRFANPTGLPDPDHHMSPVDLAKLSAHIIEHYSDYFSLFAEREFTWSDITQKNRNTLLRVFDGADGMKTGYTREAGYGLVGTAKRGDLRRIIVLNGLNSEQQRTSEAGRMMALAFSEFTQRQFFAPGQIVGHADVFMGKASSVPLVIKVDVTHLAHQQALRTASARIIYKGPLRAPVTKHAQIATLQFTLPGKGDVDYPLYAGQNVPEIGFGGKIRAGLQQLLTPPHETEQ